MDDEIVIEGFGPTDLIEQVRKLGWMPCVPSGKNFKGMSLGGYALTDPGDHLCPIRYEVTLETSGTEKTEKLVIAGFSYRDLLMGVQEGEPTWGKTTFAGHELLKEEKPGTKLFKVTIKAVKPMPVKTACR